MEHRLIVFTTFKGVTLPFVEALAPPEPSPKTVLEKPVRRGLIGTRSGCK